jgi:hypothetical protein
MSVIFPGNYVAHLNAYREQGCVALPGVEFYRAVGAVVLNPDNDNVTDADGVLVAGTYAAQVLSPDLRQDDKPRKDKALVVPAGSVVYRTAVSAPGVKAEAAGDTVKVKSATGLPTSVAVTAEADLYFPEEGATSALGNILGGTAVTIDTAIELTTDADFTASLDPSAGACRNSPSALLVEVCYYRAAPAPDVEDAHVPFAIEAGQGY